MPELLSAAYRNRVRKLSPRNQNQDVKHLPGSHTPSSCTPRQGCSRRARHRTAHAALITEILGLLTGRKPATPSRQSARLPEPLSGSETRVLRYLPTLCRPNTRLHD